MTDSPAPPEPAFAPVPRRARHDGWTPDRQRGFIAALAETGCVSRSARRVGKTPEAAYQLRRQPGAESFRAAWEAALAAGVQRLTDIAFERAIEGVAVPVFHAGRQVGERRQYNDRLLMFTLRHHAPERYGAQTGDTNAISPTTRARLKRQWEAERDGADAEQRERRALKMIRDDLVVAVRLSDKFATMHARLTDEEDAMRPDGEYDSAFRRELDAFDRLHPHVRDWTDADVGGGLDGEGWPAHPNAAFDADAFAAKLARLDGDDDGPDADGVVRATAPDAAGAARRDLFGPDDTADWPPDEDGAGEGDT